MVSLPTYDNNVFARGISNADYAKLLKNPDQPLLNHAIQAQYPPGSTYKLVAGPGALADQQDHRPRPGSRRSGYLTLGVDPVLRLEPQRVRAVQRSTAASATRATRSSSRWPASSASTASATGPSSTASARRPASTCPGEVAGHRPDQPVEAGRARRSTIFPGETYQAGIGQGYDVVTPIQLINAYAALANGGTLYQPQIVREIVGPDGKVVRPFKPERHPQDRSVAGERPQDHAQSPPARPSPLRHTYNLVDLPIKVAGKSGTAEFGTRDSKGRLPFHSWFVGFVPEGRRTADRSTSTDSQLVVLAFAYDSRTEGQRRDRDRQVLPPDALRHQEGLPAPNLLQTRQLLPEQLMGVIRAEPARVTEWAAKSVGAVWRAYDLQLTIYAGAARRDRPRDGLHATASRPARRRSPAGTTFTPRPDVGRASRSSSSSWRPPSTTAGSRPWPGRSTSSTSACWS